MSDSENEVKIPWPDESTHFFQEIVQSGWRYSTETQWHLYAEGYHQAAEKLYALWLENQRSPDHLIYPMMFLCRHYVELRLKELIQAAESLLELPTEWKLDHNLDFLVSLLQPHLKKIWPDGSNEELQNACRLIKELSSIDKTSFLFRYPVDTNRNDITKKVTSLDVDNFFDALRKLASFLDGASAGVSVYLDDLRTMR